MPEGRRRHPLSEVAAYYRDLGVRELYTQEKRSSSAQTGSPRVAETEAVFGVPSGPSLDALRAEVAACRRCTLCETRTQTVFSDGSPSARLVFVGEAPGADEDAQGVPFVGRAGQLLTKMIESGMGLSRRDVYIANILKCRPPGNRNPEPAEVAACRGYLEAQLAAVKPEVIVGLGTFACHFLLGTEEGITRLRGRWGEYRGIPVMPTFHPSYLLRQAEKKKETWADLQQVMSRLGISRPAPR